MSRIGFACAVIALVTLPACSLGMEDLSTQDDDGRTNPVATNGSGPVPSGEAVTQPDDEQLPEVDVKLDDPASPAAPPSAPPMAPGCQLVTFTPASAQSVGGGQAWSGGASALADDGAYAKASLSTDNRESAMLVFGGFTGPAIPANAVIKGLLVDVDRSSGGSCITAKTVTATIGGATRVRPDANDAWQGIRFYGGVEDTWGGAIAPADVGAGLTVSLQTRLVGSASECKPRDARIDTLRVRVHYCVD